MHSSPPQTTNSDAAAHTSETLTRRDMTAPSPQSPIHKGDTEVTATFDRVDTVGTTTSFATAHSQDSTDTRKHGSTEKLSPAPPAPQEDESAREPEPDAAYHSEEPVIRDEKAPQDGGQAEAQLARTVTGGSGRPYSAFPKRTKWLIAGLGGVAAVFSPISSNIFVPAIPALASAFHRSEQDISLAVTTYLVFQAVTPSFFGSASDTFGRRPIFLLVMAIYIGANIGLALCPTSEYWLLLFLRAVQATGGSGVVSIGAGAISDVALPREKGKYMAVFQSSAMLGPSFGPLLGGILAQTLGWRSIFWFLTIATCCVMLPFLFLYPETLRSLVGDGSLPPPTICSSPIAIWQEHQRKKKARAEIDAGEGAEVEEEVEQELATRAPRKKYNPLTAFQCLLVPEVLLVFVFVSLPYLEFYCVLVVFSTALKDNYGLSELHIGLCYLPGGAGTIASALVNGQLLDRVYRREEARVGGDFRKCPTTFRLERTRLWCMYPFALLFIVACIGLGWCLQAKAHLAAVLVMQFFVGFGTGTTSMATIYGQDVLPGKGGAVSASLNLVRCAFGAVGSAVIQIVYGRLGAGWTFVLFSGICLAGFPLAFIAEKYAGGWREKRAEKRAAGTLWKWMPR